MFAVRSRLRGKPHDLEPELSKLLDCVGQAFKCYGLRNEGIDSEVVRPEDVLFRLRRCQDNNRNAPERWIRLDLLQRLSSVFAGHIEVEQDQARSEERR